MIKKMKELRVHIQHVRLREFKNNKNATKTEKKILVFMGKVLLLTTKFETGFQSCVLAIFHRDMKPDQNAHQTSTKML